MHSVSFVKTSQLSKGVAKAQKAWVRALGAAPLPFIHELPRRYLLGTCKSSEADRGTPRPAAIA
jgi:hypothetical protein